jgi:glucose/mannose transport system substrate-binding protein
MRRSFVGVLGNLSVVGFLGLAACGSGVESEQAGGEQQLELYSWWTNPGETEALAELLRIYHQKFPQTNINSVKVEQISDAQAQLRSRMLESRPPDTFQVIGGNDLMQWVAYNGRDDSDSKMEPLDFLYSQNNWSSVIPKAVQNFVSYNGKAYGVPIALHRTNVLFYNKKLLSQNGLSAPTTLDEFYQVADALKAKGITPFATGAKIGFVAALLAWDGVFIAKAGAAFRDSYFAGKESPNDPRVIETLTETAKMLSYAPADNSSLTWDQAAQRVVDGTVAMTVVGDWAKGFFLSKGMVPDVDIGAVPVPGTGGNFVYLVDAFGLPKGAPDRKAALNFLTLIGSSEAQNAFNPIKGATPPRTDADKSLYDVLAQHTLGDFQTDVLSGSRSIVVASPDFNTELENTMKQFAFDGNVDTVLFMLKNQYDRLHQ